jgi:SAM-dependent MidA family methyltransferase
MSANLPKPSAEALAHSAQLCTLIQQDIAQQGGWIPFSRFMELALYAPNLGYYSAGARKFGEAGDFITAPELSSLFGRTVARQVADIMTASAPHILELGAGSGKLAVDILSELERLNALPAQYSILEVSADLRERQRELVQQQIPQLAHRVNWLDALPEKIVGAVIANEVLDALPAHLVHWSNGQIFERGVVITQQQFDWQDRLPENENLIKLASAIHTPADYLSEISPASRGLVSSLSERFWRSRVLSSATRQRHANVPLPPPFARSAVLFTGPARHHRPRRFHRHRRSRH